MVLGYGDGALQILVDKPEYHEGETIRGKVVINLRSTRAARCLSVRLFAKEGEIGPGNNKRRELYSNAIRLDGTKKYIEGQHEYPFEMLVPLVSKLHAGSPLPFEWNIEARLDVPFALDIRAVEKIYIR
jgi:hypothetical protein